MTGSEKRDPSCGAGKPERRRGAPWFSTAVAMHFRNAVAKVGPSLCGPAAATPSTTIGGGARSDQPDWEYLEPWSRMIHSDYGDVVYTPGCRLRTRRLSVPVEGPVAAQRPQPLRQRRRRTCRLPHPRFPPRGRRSYSAGVFTYGTYSRQGCPRRALHGGSGVGTLTVGIRGRAMLEACASWWAME